MKALGKVKEVTKKAKNYVVENRGIICFVSGIGLTTWFFLSKVMDQSGDDAFIEVCTDPSNEYPYVLKLTSTDKRGRESVCARGHFNENALDQIIDAMEKVKEIVHKNESLED